MMKRMVVTGGVNSSKLKAVLERCRQNAKNGFEIAKLNNEELERIIEEQEKGLAKLMEDLEGKELPENSKRYINKLVNSLEKLNELHREIKEELEHNRDNLTDFNIVVYGKTMTGKSTLMETLLNGNGQSIGKGTQRTTLDIRAYKWNNLQIYDTPGIAAGAAGGREDERKAYEIAKEADMIIFLLGDDNISDEEASAFAKLKRMGKPILVALNAKYDLTNKRSAKLMLKKFDNVMSKERIAEVERDFIAHVNNQKVSWQGVQFVGVHLQAAYLALKGKCPIEGVSVEQLAAMSNFSTIEQAIVEEIVGKGDYYQQKVFIDLAYKQTEEIFAEIATELELAKSIVAAFINNKDKLKNIKAGFKEYGKTQIENLIAREKRNLEDKMPGFVDYYYDDEGAGKAWSRVIADQKIKFKINKLFGELQKELFSRIEEFQKEFAQEVKANISTDGLSYGIKGIDIDDLKSDLKITVDVAGIVVTAAALLGTIELSIPVIGWAVFGLTCLIEFLFDDKEDKIREAKANMRRQLQKSIDELDKKLDTDLKKTFETFFLKGCLDAAQTNFTNTFNQLELFKESEESLNEKLQVQLENMNRQLLEAAGKCIGIPELAKNCIKLRRIAGQEITLTLKEAYQLERAKLLELENLLQEKVKIA